MDAERRSHSSAKVKITYSWEESERVKSKYQTILDSPLQKSKNLHWEGVVTKFVYISVGRTEETPTCQSQGIKMKVRDVRTIWSNSP